MIVSLAVQVLTLATLFNRKLRRLGKIVSDQYLKRWKTRMRPLPSTGDLNGEIDGRSLGDADLVHISAELGRRSGTRTKGAVHGCRLVCRNDVSTRVSESLK